MKWMELPDYGIIDAHMHPYLKSHRNFPFDIPQDYDAFFAEQRRAGIALSCGAFNIYNDGSDFSVIRECNERVLALHRARTQEFLPGVNIHPFFPEESCQEVQKFYDMGFRWVGEIASYVMGYKKYCSPGMFQIIELIRDRDMVLNFHPSTPEDLEEMARNFPTLKIVLAHPGFPDNMVNFHLAEKYSNINFDISGSGLTRWGMLKKGMELIGPERFLFGTDFPVINSGMYVAGALFDHLPPAWQKMLFRENFLRILGSLPPQLEI